MGGLLTKAVLFIPLRFISQDNITRLIQTDAVPFEIVKQRETEVGVGRPRHPLEPVDSVPEGSRTLSNMGTPLEVM